MLEITWIALATFFSTIGPLDVAAVFAALTTSATPDERRSYAVRGILIATVILGLFALTGDFLLAGFGISMAALRTAGGVLLLLIGNDMVFARPSGAITTTSEEIDEARLKHDISVFPLATPLIAGPGTIGAVILLMADAKGNLGHQAAVLLALLAMILFTLVALLTASQIPRLLGVTGIHVIKASMLRGGYNVLSAVTAEGEMDYSIQDGTFNGERYIGFLGGLIAGRKRPLIVLADHDTFHQSKQVRDRVRAHRSQLRVFFLPKRAPEYNPDEQVWNEVKNNRIGKQPVKNKEDLKARLTSALDSLKNKTPSILFLFSICRTPSMRRVSFNQLRTL